MVDLTWRTLAPVEEERTYPAVVTELKLESAWTLPGFLWDTLRVRHQLGGTPGVVGLALRAKPMARTFWTISAWESRAAIGRFLPAGAHGDVMHAYEEVLEHARFLTTEVDGAKLPVDVAEGIGWLRAAPATEIHTVVDAVADREPSPRASPEPGTR